MCNHFKKIVLYSEKMRVVIQRVSRASVKVKNKVVGKIGQGLVVLLAVGEGDREKEAEKLAEKIIQMRIFENEKSHFDRSLLDVGGEILVVPQFTLFADTTKGRRPYFGQAAKPGIAERLFKKFIATLKEKGIKVEKGIFGAKMKVLLINDGPVTIILES